jgi:subtilisin family serine protease
MVGDASDVDMAHAFNFAAQHWNQLGGGVTARVLSCSKARAWYTNPITRKVEPSGWANFDIINNAISNAANAGIVICAPTDNSGLASIAYPASNPNVIACGASDKSDKRCSFSNYGTELSIVAPGTMIVTTDATGLVPSDIYKSNWEGTSAAAPQVAGLAALLFSKYPALTSKKVRDIIERSADKVGGYTYSAFKPSGAPYPNGTWNDKTGYGRINVLKALEIAPSF